MKRICIVVTVASTIKAFFLEQIIYLSKNGYEVTIICNMADQLGNIVDNNIKCISVPMKRGLDPLGAITAMKIMYKIFKENKFDIVQYSTPNAALYASIASKLVGIKIRLYHNMGYRYAASEGIKRGILKTLEKITCKLSTEIQPVSFSNLEFGVRENLFPINKARVIWNGSTGGVDLSKFDIHNKEEWKLKIYEKYGIEPNTFVYGFVGRITKDKGINELLQAYKDIMIQNKKTKLMLVGREEDTNSLDQQLYNWAKEQESIIFIGYSEDIHEYFAAFNVMILPSYREGFGNVIIESQAMGVPVIVTDIPGPTDAMKQNVTGLVVPKQDTQALLEAMKQVITDDGLLEKMSKSSYQYAKDYFDSKVLMQYILKDKEILCNKQ